ncbi:hypothetical protein FJY94_04205 [Candidatus Kaiserbacteria bacterium]|nr:hypothetical protein [Candidatus Kaiserbacteria bacterium]
MASIASERLQDMLDFWLDECRWHEFFVNAHDKSALVDMKIPKVIYNWSIFTEILFDNEFTSLDPEQWTFSGNDYPSFTSVAKMGTVPLEMFAWTRRSRVSYVLPKGLQRLFVSATYPNVRWEDVLLPFDSFVIVLEEPFRLEEEDGVWSEFDAILVTTYDGDGDVALRLMRRSLVPAQVRRFPERAVRRFDITRRRDQTKAREQLIRHYVEWREPLGLNPEGRLTSLFMCQFDSPHDRVRIEPGDFARQYSSSELLGRTEAAWRFDPHSWAAKIVVGWCLYLQSMSSSNLAWSQHRERVQFRRGRRGLTGVITNVDHVCTILGSGTLDPTTYGLSEQEHREGSSFFVRPHWRRAHMRREPGTAPDTPKTVKVPPVLVRKDLLPLFGLVGGTNTRVLDEE